VSRHQFRVRIITAAVAATAVAGAVVAVASGSERDPERSVEAYCSALEEARDLDQSFATLDAERLGPEVDALRRATKVAPEEIAPDLETILVLTMSLQETIATSPTDKGAALEEALRAHAEQLAAVDAAGQRVQVYSQTHCGIELNTTETPAP
jgi:hypothetical protein